MSAGKLCCFIHSEREAVVTLKVPCAPGGMLHLCYECGKLEQRKLVFEAYWNLRKSALALERLKAAVSASAAFREKKGLN